MAAIHITNLAMKCATLLFARIFQSNAIETVIDLGNRQGSKQRYHHTRAVSFRTQSPIVSGDFPGGGINSKYLHHFLLWLLPVHCQICNLPTPVISFVKMDLSFTMLGFLFIPPVFICARSHIFHFTYGSTMMSTSTPANAFWGLPSSKSKSVTLRLVWIIS